MAFTFAISLALAGFAAAAPFATQLSPVSRANEQDVAAKFDRAYSYQGGCPSRVELSNVAQDPNTKVYTVKHSDITEFSKSGASAQCPAVGTMRLITAGEARRPNRLAELGFPIAARTIGSNINAKAVLASSSGAAAEMLIGFDEGARTCNGITYPEGTFFFFVRQNSDLNINIQRNDPKDPSLIQRTAITIPSTKRTLFITGPGDQLCLLEDRTTAVDRGVQINGRASPSPRPTPSKSKVPAASKSAAPVAVPKGPPTPPAITPAVTATPTPVAPTPVIIPGPLAEESPSPEESAAPPAPTSNGAVCFPGSATVELESGKRVRMADIHIGDRVRSGLNTFSDVFLFTHRDAEVQSQFVRLVTAAGESVTLTKSHYIYANSALVSAGAVRRGDTLQLADGSSSPVTAIEDISATGLYNPQTVDGNIVVDGVLASAYTMAVHPRVAHKFLLAPLRFLYARSAAAVPALERLASFIGQSTDALSALVPSGPPAMCA